MDFIQQVYKGSYEWWKYLVGFLIIFIFWQLLGGIPLIIAIISEVGLDSLSSLNADSMMNVLSKNSTLFFMLLTFAIGLLGLVITVKYLHKQPFKSLTTTRKMVDWSRVFFAFALIAIPTIALTAIDYYLHPEDYVLQFEMVPFLIMAVIAILLIPLQTSFEEYLFRGYFMQGIGAMAKNKWVPLILTSLVFGLLHIANPEVDKLGYTIMIYYIGTGLLLGIMTLMDDGMELALGFHAGNNLIGVMLVTADWTAFQTNSILTDISDPEGGFMEIFIPVFVMYPIFLFILAKKYNWTNWKEKLTGKVEEVSTSDDDYKILE